MDIIKTRAKDVDFKDIFPTPSARNNDRNLGDRLRCKQCGFPINTAQVTDGSGYGNLITEVISGETAYTDDNGNTFYRVLNPVTKAGCPMCNSSNWK